jgi:D-lactate dehydrogenase
MKVAFFDTHGFERPVFERELSLHPDHSFTFHDLRLNAETALIAAGNRCVCIFVNDRVDQNVARILAEGGVKLLALRSAGFNHVDLPACAASGITVVRVPAYSPHAVAEHAVCLLLALNRKIHRAYQRVRELNFSLDGLVGFDLCGKTVGVIGTGRIGAVFAQIMRGFQCTVLAHDPVESTELKNLGVRYVSLEELYRLSDVVSLHVPLTKGSHHIIDARALTLMKRGVVLINTSRGGLIDTKALIEALKSEHVRGAGLDVYEEEEGLFFFDLSARPLQDDVLARLLTFPNVVITSHQAFLTDEALTAIARTTIENITAFERGSPLLSGTAL